MSDCCDFLGIFCCCCLCSSGAGGAWCNSSPNGNCRLCCGSRRHEDIEGLEDIDAFNQQFNAQYDPNHNAIYNETPDGVGHRTVQTQPMGNHGMMTQTRALGGDAPFATRPPTDQLPAYSSRPPSMMTAGGGNTHRRGESHPQDRSSRPPASMTPAGGNSHRRGESHPEDRSSRPPSSLIPAGGNSHRHGESHPEDRLSRPPPALTAGNHRRERSNPPNASYQPNY